MVILFLTSTLWLFPAPAQAQKYDCQNGFEGIYDGIKYKKETSNNPRLLAIYTVKIDLNNPNVGVFITPKDGLGTTTSTFLENYGLQLAINGDESINSFPKGMAASQGNIYAPKTNEPVVFFSQEKEATMGHDIPSPIWNAVAGSHTIVENGKVGSKISTCSKPEYCEHLQPRTAVGVTANNQLIIFVIDGRQTGYSEGLTLIELANFMLTCGAESAINLDGGGSTTLVTENEGVLNQPSDNQERVVANHLGIYAKPGAGYVPPEEPPGPPGSPGSPGGPMGELFCDKSFKTTEDEAHPLRPNAFNVCPAEPKGPECSDDVVATKTVNIPVGSGKCRPIVALPGATVRCVTDVSFSIPISINLSELDLPVAGIADRDCESGTCLADIFPMGEKMANYTSWYQQAINAEQANSAPEYQEQVINAAGPIYKLVPPEIIDAAKENLVKRAKSNKIYDQIVCYLENGKVISRPEAKEKIKAGEEIDRKRLSDFKNHLNPRPGDEPWRACWQQIPLSATNDEYGEVELKASVSDPDVEVTGLNPVTVAAAFPHLKENADLTSNLLLPIFQPNIKNEMENWGSSCNADKAISVGQYAGDRIGTNRTITRTITVVKKNVEYSYKVPKMPGVRPSGSVEVSVSVPISVTTKPPKELQTVWQNLVGGKASVFRAFAPAAMKLEDLPVERNLNISCGPGCAIDPRHSQAVFAHLGGVKKYFQETLQAMFNPFKKVAFNQLEEEAPGGGVCENAGFQVTEKPASTVAAIADASRQECVDGEILQAILNIEAGFNYNSQTDFCAVGRCGAVGPMQHLSGWEHVNCDTSQCGGNICEPWCTNYANGDPSEKQRIENLFGGLPADVNPCNLDDALIWAAKKLKGKGEIPQSGCLTVNDTEALIRATMSYYGNSYNPTLTPSQNCTNPEDRLIRADLPGWETPMTYCEYVFYQLGLTPP